MSTNSNSYHGSNSRHVEQSTVNTARRYVQSRIQALESTLGQLWRVELEPEDLHLDAQGDEEDSDDVDDTFSWSQTHGSQQKKRRGLSTSNLFVLVLSLGWFFGLFYLFPFPTTIHVFLGAAVATLLWTVTQLFELCHTAVLVILQSRKAQTHFLADHRLPLLTQHRTQLGNRYNIREYLGRCIPASWSTRKTFGVTLATLLSIALLANATPPSEDQRRVPVLHQSLAGRPEKYFIAANLYNNDESFEQWAHELVQLCGHCESAGHVDESKLICLIDTSSGNRKCLYLHS